MQIKKSQQMFLITLEFSKETTKTVKIKASNREVAEARAMKHNPRAVAVKQNAPSL